MHLKTGAKEVERLCKELEEHSKTFEVILLADLNIRPPYERILNRVFIGDSYSKLGRISKAGLLCFGKYYRSAVSHRYGAITTIIDYVMGPRKWIEAFQQTLIRHDLP